LPVLSLSSITKEDAWSGLIIVLAARDIQFPLLISKVMIVQVSDILYVAEQFWQLLDFIFGDKPTTKTAVDLDICGTEKLTVYQSGLIYFQNTQVALKCHLDNGFKVGSKCEY